MPKALSLFGMAVAVLVLLIFVLELALGIPFNVRDQTFAADICFAIGAAALAYMGWESFREQT